MAHISIILLTLINYLLITFIGSKLIPSLFKGYQLIHIKVRICTLYPNKGNFHVSDYFIERFSQSIQITVSEIKKRETITILTAHDFVLVNSNLKWLSLTLQFHLRFVRIHFRFVRIWFLHLIVLQDINKFH